MQVLVKGSHFLLEDVTTIVTNFCNLWKRGRGKMCESAKQAKSGEILEYIWLESKIVFHN